MSVNCDLCVFLFLERYEENNLKVGRKKINLMFVGDGKGKTVISGGKSIFDNITTFHTASFGEFFLSLALPFYYFPFHFLNSFEIIQQ